MSFVHVVFNDVVFNDVVFVVFKRGGGVVFKLGVCYPLGGV